MLLNLCLTEIEFQIAEGTENIDAKTDAEPEGSEYDGRIVEKVELQGGENAGEDGGWWGALECSRKWDVGERRRLQTKGRGERKRRQERMHCEW